MRKLPFKKEYIKKLEELGILKTFIKNFNNPQWGIDDVELTKRYRKRCINANSWYDFIVNAFNWGMCSNSIPSINWGEISNLPYYNFR